MFTRSQSTMFRAVHSVHFITVSLEKKCFIFQKNFTFSSKQACSVQRAGLCFVKFIYRLLPTSPRSTIYLFVLFSNFFQLILDLRSPIPDPRSPIPDPRSPYPRFPILDPRSLILDPPFLVNLEVLLIKIVLFLLSLK